MDYLKTIPAKALILVFDMCRENVNKSKGIQKNTLTPAPVKGVEVAYPTPAPGTTARRPELVATFFACSPEGSSYEMPGRNRGYFSFDLEQGLRGYAADKRTGQVSLAGLQNYLATAVPQAVQMDRPGGLPQAPTSTIIGPLNGGGFIVVKVEVSTITGITNASPEMNDGSARKRFRTHKTSRGNRACCLETRSCLACSLASKT